MKKKQIGVLGWAGKDEYPKGKGPSQQELKDAEEIGKALAKQNCILVTGGKSGVMEYASRGAKKENGTTVGVISSKRNTSNEFIDIEIITGSWARGFDEFIIPNICDAVIVIGGGAGTLAEICGCYRNKTPIVFLATSKGWVEYIQKLNLAFLDERKSQKILLAQSPEEAVELAIKETK